MLNNIENEILNLANQFTLLPKEDYENIYSNNELIGIIAGNYCDYECVINETTGDCSIIHETR